MLSTQVARMNRAITALRTYRQNKGGWLRAGVSATKTASQLVWNEGLFGSLRTMKGYIHCANTPVAEPIPEPEVIAPPPVVDPAKTYTEMLTHLGTISLDVFLATNSRLTFPSSDCPDVSIVLVLYNRSELTLLCLKSLLAQQGASYEIILVDNNSQDQTSELLGRLDGVTIIRNESNKGFVEAVNQGAIVSRGKYLLLLNNDTQVLGNTLATAATYMDSHDDVGALGARIILASGELQEAGSVIYDDATCEGYGRGGNPNAGEFQYIRDVDYCSGAFLLTRREQFLDLGMLDEIYSPAYYEEVDYCIRLHKAGQRIVYHPDLVILHYEFASSEKKGHAFELMERNREIVVHKHRDWLSKQQKRGQSEVLSTRQRIGSRQKILFIEDHIPHPWIGAGFPRTKCILDALCDAGHFVTYYPTEQENAFDCEWNQVYQTCPRGVEIALRGGQSFAEFLNSRKDYYDLIWISRPNNMAALQELVKQGAVDLGQTPVCYDAEAVFTMRDILFRQVTNEPMTDIEAETALRQELALAEGTNAIVSVSALEVSAFEEHGFQNVHRLSHTVQQQPGTATFDERDDVLFLGSVHGLLTPNADSIGWLATDIYPAIRRKFSNAPQLKIAGTTSLDLSAEWPESGLEFLGPVGDLAELYNQTRIFVVPTRYSAGVPLKIYEAAAHGLPVVATSLLAKQLGWEDGKELLVADTPEEFASQIARLYEDEQLWMQLRKHGLEAVKRDCSQQAFSLKVQHILASTMNRSVLAQSA